MKQKKGGREGLGGMEKDRGRVEQGRFVGRRELYEGRRL